MGFLIPPTNKTLVWIDPTKCKACSICVSYCPSGSLSMVQDASSTLGAIVEVISPESCIGCKDCELHCSDFAIFVVEKSNDIKFAKLTEDSKNRANLIKTKLFSKN